MIKWERLDSTHVGVYRAKVPGGWLVAIGNATKGGGLIFYPDPNHTWNGNSLP